MHFADDISRIEIRPYMYRTIVYLVGVHAQVSSAAERLIEQTMTHLVDELATEALRCFGQIDRFGMGGMLRVRNVFLSPFPHLMLLGRPLWKSSTCIRR